MVVLHKADSSPGMFMLLVVRRSMALRKHRLVCVSENGRLLVAG